MEIKKWRFLLFTLFLIVFLSACGGGPGGGGSADVPENPPASEGRTFVFLPNEDDPAKSVLPAPSVYSQILLSGESTRAGDFPAMYLDPNQAGSIEEAALYALWNAAQMKGFSPNMYISVPVYYPVDPNSVDGKYVLFDLTALQNQDLGLLNQSDRLVVRVYNYADNQLVHGIIRFYPVEPLEPGHVYVLLLLKGIKTLDGKELPKLQHVLYQYLEATDQEAGELRDKLLAQFTGALREKIEASLGLLDGLRMGINALESGQFGIVRDNVILAVPFQVASNTFSVAAFQLLQACSQYTSVDAVESCVESNFNDTMLLPYDEAGREAYGIASAAKIVLNTYYNVLNATYGGNATLVHIAFCGNFTQTNVVKSFDVTMLLPNVEKILEYYLTNDTASLASLSTSVATNQTMKIDVPYVVSSASDTSAVLMFQHGLGGDKTLATIVGDMLHSSGYSYPVVGIDLPWHGDRVTTEPPCNASGVCFLTENVAQDRLNFYQALLDQTVTALVVKAGCLDLDNDTSTVDVPNNFFYSGISLGGITGANFVSTNYDVTGKAVLNVGGANYAALLDEATRAPLVKLICTSLGGGEICDDTNSEALYGFVNNLKPTLAYNLLLGIFQTILDPSDPAYVVRYALRKNAELLGLDVQGDFASKVILQNAYGDTFVPNVSNEALARAFGYSEKVDVLEKLAVNDWPVLQSGWYMFGNATNWAVHSFILVDALYQKCGLDRSADSASKRTCLLGIYPELTDYADFIDPDIIENLADAAWLQTVGFLQ